MHWGRFLLNTFPRDRFPTPGSLRIHNRRGILHNCLRIPILLRHNLLPIDLIGHRWGIAVCRGMLQSWKHTALYVFGMGVLCLCLCLSTRCPDLCNTGRAVVVERGSLHGCVLVDHIRSISRCWLLLLCLGLYRNLFLWRGFPLFAFLVFHILFQYPWSQSFVPFSWLCRLGVARLLLD